MKVVFSSSKTLGGALIRYGTMSEWCHVDMLFDDGTLIGSTGFEHGVRKSSLMGRLRGAHKILQYRIDEIQLPDENKAREFAEAQIGKPYDYTAMLAFVYPWRGNWQDDDSWFCSELVASAIVAGGTQIVRADAWRVTPAHLDVSPLLKIVFPTHKL